MKFFIAYPIQKLFGNLISRDIDKEQLKEIRTSIRTGRPFTSNRCLKAIEEKLARKLAAFPIGRPKKNA